MPDTLDAPEAWRARDLMALFEYGKWDNFRKVLAKAWEACKGAGIDPAGHFWRADGSSPWDPAEAFIPEVGKKSGRGRPSEDVMVSRYAAYLAAQNADPSKPPVAFAQRYFAEQTRRQELVDESVEALTEDQRRVLIRDEVTKQNKGLASAANASGVKTPKDFAIFQTEGYKGMYGGLNVDGIKRASVAATAKYFSRFIEAPSITARDETLITRICQRECYARATWLGYKCI